MSDCPLERKFENDVTSATAPAIKPSFDPAHAADGIEGTLYPASNPTIGTLVISPDLDLKIRKALTRAARQIAFRQQLRLPGLYLIYFVLEARRMMLLMRRQAAGYVGYLGFNRRHRNISPSDGKILP
jgi:hypothetical protein